MKDMILIACILAGTIGVSIVVAVSIYAKRKFPGHEHEWATADEGYITVIDKGREGGLRRIGTWHNLKCKKCGEMKRMEFKLNQFSG